MCWSPRPTSSPRRSFNRDYFENQPIWNLGCVSQRNLAVMADEPADLLQPRGETPAYRCGAPWSRNSIARWQSGSKVEFQNTDMNSNATNHEFSE
jgi:type IV pilus biogenesis protein CpaD/CtpE